MWRRWKVGGRALMETLREQLPLELPRGCRIETSGVRAMVMCVGLSARWASRESTNTRPTSNAATQHPTSQPLSSWYV